jgi:hypothetical protein
MFDRIRHLSDKGFKEELVENVEKGFLCARHYLNAILYIHVYIFCSSFLYFQERDMLTYQCI